MSAPLKTAGLNRRTLLAATAMLPAALMRRRAAAATGPRVVAFDWGLAETLLALGVTPVGAAETQGYREWVGEPPLPGGVTDVGLRLEPNFEAVAALKPDLIVTTPQLAPFVPMLERIAPTRSFAIFAPNSDVWTRAQDVTRALAEATGRAEAGARLIAAAEAALAAAQPEVGGLAGRPLYLASFVDGRHVRVYGRGSLFDAVLTRLGLANAFTGPTSFWGFATFGLEHLAAPADATLMVFEPVPEEARATMEHGALWRRLPMVEQGHVGLLPPVWSFGGLVSAMRFARVLARQARSPALSGGGEGERHG